MKLLNYKNLGTNMKSNITVQDWHFSWIENAVVVKNKISIKMPKDISAGNYPTIKATVPGNFELDFTYYSVDTCGRRRGQRVDAGEKVLRRYEKRF